MKRYLIGAVSAVAAYAITRRKQKAPAPSTFEWISADEPKERPNPDEPMPMFYVGDAVILYSPYTAEFFTNEWQLSPIVYEITDVKYDEDDEVFRYRLKNGAPADWYSEDWLSLPSETAFIKQGGRGDAEEEQTITPEFIEMESRILSKHFDDQARKATIDMHLDAMNKGTPEEKVEAERLLAEMTE